MNDPWQGGEEVLEVVEDVAGALDLPGKGVHVRLTELQLATVVTATPAGIIIRSNVSHSR